MARSGFNDDGNEPRYNFVPHVAGSDEERGLPVKGKLVWRSDTEAYEYCTDTSPDSTLYGGGTWGPIGGTGLGLSDIYTYTPTVTQGATTFTITGSTPFSVYRVIPDSDGLGYTVLGNMGFVINTGSGSSGSAFVVSGPPVTTNTGSDSYVCGAGWWSSISYPNYTIQSIYPHFISGQFEFTVPGTRGLSPVLGIDPAVGISNVDQFHFSYQLLYAV